MAILWLCIEPMSLSCGTDLKKKINIQNLIPHTSCHIAIFFIVLLLPNCHNS